MPKVVLNDAKGVTQSRGAGVHHLSSSNKGFARQVFSASVSSGVGQNQQYDIDSGIAIPPNACVELIALKVGTLYANGATATGTSINLDGFKLNGEAYTIATDGASADGYELHTDGTPVSVGLTAVFNLGGADIANTETRDLIAPLPSETSTGTVELTFTDALSDAAADDTQAVVEVIVQVLTPRL